VVRVGLDQRSCCTPDPVSVVKQSRYVTSHLHELSIEKCKNITNTNSRNVCIKKITQIRKPEILSAGLKNYGLSPFLATLGYGLANF